MDSNSILQNPLFWRAQHAALLVLYGVAAAVAIGEGPTHFLVLLAGVLLLLHVAEIPLALKLLRSQQPDTARVAVRTILFGFTWWLPAQRGVFPCR